MKVLIVADSLALPGHNNKYEETWVYKLKKEYTEHDFIIIAQRGSTTDVLVEMGGGKNGIDNMLLGVDCLEFFEPDFVIIQLGIVDCAPRLFKKDSFGSKIISRLPPFLRTQYIKFV